MKNSVSLKLREREIEIMFMLKIKLLQRLRSELSFLRDQFRQPRRTMTMMLMDN